MLCVYDKKTTKDNFNNNGLGILVEPVAASITLEKNGDYSLYLEYPANSKKVQYLKQFNIVKADGQLFRIYKVEQEDKSNKVVKVWARHIFYDLYYYFIEDQRAEKAPVKTAMQKALNGDAKSVYTVDSDIVVSNSIYFIETNGVEAMFGILEKWGLGELLRDNFDIKILKALGKETGLLIKYGRNIQGITVTTDIQNVVTQIYPIGKNNVRLTEKYILIPSWNGETYPSFPLTKKVEFDASDEPTLRAIAQEAAKTIGLSLVNIAVDFIELSRTAEYENYKQLETVNLGDIVTVKHSELGIDVKVEVIKVVKDLLNAINTKVELGQPKSSGGQDINAIIKTVSDSLGNQVAQAVSSMLYYANPTALSVSTTTIQPIYLGVTAVANTNLSANFALYCTASAACTLTMQIQLDSKDIPFTPKVKLQQGDNVIGIPLGIPQVAAGGHYLGVFLRTDTGTVTIPIYNLQCMVDGRNLQGGLSAEPPHAEIKQAINYFELMNGRTHTQRVQVSQNNPTSSSPKTVVQFRDVNDGKVNIANNIAMTKVAEEAYFGASESGNFTQYPEYIVFDGTARFINVTTVPMTKSTLGTGIMFTGNLLDSTNYTVIEKTEVV